MKTYIVDAGLDPSYVRVSLGKQSYLKLTHEEFKQGVQRGKAEQRALRRAARAAQMQARDEAATLEWIQ